MDLCYGPTSHTTSYSLLELPPELLDALDSSASDWVITGQPNDEACFCSSTQTYALRACQNSNSLLLCSDDADDNTWDESRQRVEVLTTLHQTLELVKIRPHVDRIADLLADSEWLFEMPAKRVGFPFWHF